MICLRFAFVCLLLLTLVAEAASGQVVTDQKVHQAMIQLEPLITKMHKQTGVPGVAVAIVYQDRAVFLKGFGLREVRGDQPVDGDTVFQVASVSKPLAATVIAALVGEGSLDWDDNITKYDPGFRLSSPWLSEAVTFRDLLCHRSGLPDHAGDFLETIGHPREYILGKLRMLRPEAGFRTRCLYTNYGFTEAGIAAALAAGTTWEELAEAKLYRPLGMKSTSSRHADFQARSNKALPHVQIEGKWIAKYDRDPDPQSPAGGVSASANDLGRWLRLLLAEGRFEGKQVIPAEALAETHHPQILTGTHPINQIPTAYGLGWNVSYQLPEGKHLSHSGGFDLGIRTEVHLLPDHDLGIVTLTNGADTGLPEAINRSFLDLVVHGNVQRDWLKLMTEVYRTAAHPEPEVDYSQSQQPVHPPLPFSAYTGKYENAYYGPIEIVSTGKQLQLLIGPKPQRYRLTHWNRDRFTYQLQGESAGPRSGVAFQLGPDAHATEVRIENLDEHGLGKFVREQK